MDYKKISTYLVAAKQMLTLYCYLQSACSMLPAAAVVVHETRGGSARGACSEPLLAVADEGELCVVDED